MTAIATLLVVLTVSLLAVRVATVMLVLTGLSLPLAKFQARSAFTGCGYTTVESEQLVSHPVRRRIISTLMLLGNAGIVTTIGTLMAGLVVADAVVPIWGRLLFLMVGVAALWAVASSRVVERIVNNWTFKLLKKYTKLEVRDYANLMHLSGEYGISELRVGEDDWLAERELKELRLTKEGVVVLGINRRDGSYIGAPRADTVAHAGDTMIVYGSGERLRELDGRRADPKGWLRHVEAVADQRARSAGESAKDSKDAATKAKSEAEAKAAEADRDAVRQTAADLDRGVVDKTA